MISIKRTNKLFTVLFISTLTFYSCQKDDLTQEVEPQEEDYLTPMPDQTIEGDFDIIFQSENPTSLKYVSELYDSEFIDGGMAMVAGQLMRTVIIGNQRWTLMDYMLNLEDLSLTALENEIYGDYNTTSYYSYNLAMTLNDSPTMINYYAPSGLVEVSNWRIPTLYDENNLGYMAAGDDEAISTALEYEATGMIYHEYDVITDNDTTYEAIYYNSDKTVHWNSEYTAYDGTSGNGIYGTWQLAGGNCVDYIYLFQFQYMSPHAPIRLVQDIEPME